MTKIHAIRAEFQEPFRDVVKGFALMHYSRRATAETLGINNSYFYQICTRFDLHRYFVPANYLPICKPPGHKKGKQIRQPQRYTDEELLAALRQYSQRITMKHYDTIQQKPCADTIIRRFGTWKKAKKIASEI